MLTDPQRSSLVTCHPGTREGSSAVVGTYPVVGREF